MHSIQWVNMWNAFLITQLYNDTSWAHDVGYWFH